MEFIKYPERKIWHKILQRPAIDVQKLDSIVIPILDEVKENGDAAVLKYTKQFDKADISELLVTIEEIDAAIKQVPEKLKESILLAINNISKFHKAQQSEKPRITMLPGVECWQKPVPISKVGLYIPGGTAPLFSTILMLAIPAKIAGCEEIILCSPPSSEGKLNPAILYAANKVGINKVFKTGGVQAIAAMAYGTETVPKVYKIFGPGNQYVMAAKQLVARDSVAIDMPAGPSEVMVLADQNSNPVYLASDLLSQAEHGTDSQVLLVSTDEQKISDTLAEIEKQLALLPKSDIAEKSLQNSKAILVKDKDEMMEIVNQYAPEHLIISTTDALELAERVVNAGSVFIGEFTPESAGDYASGTNHTLPTHGWAKAFSGVNLDSFLKKITFQQITREGLEKIGPAIEEMAEAEELIAHKRAVSVRLKKY